ncbi:MAG: peptidase [Bacteroidota bacterium]
MIHPKIKNKWDEDICLMLSVDNYKKQFLCDCGMASELTAGDCTKVEAVFVSHTHIDHFSNFDALIRHQLGLGNTLLVCGPEGIQRNVQGKLNGYLWNLIEPGSLAFEVREIVSEHQVNCYKLEPPHWEIQALGSKDGPIYKNKMLAVQFAILDHGTPSIAYLFEEITRLKVRPTPYEPGPWVGALKRAFQNHQPDTLLEIPDHHIKAGALFEYLYEQPGYKLAYVMDHLASAENHEKIMNLCRDVDNLIIETYYRDIDRGFAEKNFHSTAKASGTIARLVGAKHTFFVHHSRRYSNEIEDLLEEARAAYEDREPVFRHQVIARFD